MAAVSVEARNVRRGHEAVGKAHAYLLKELRQGASSERLTMVGSTLDKALDVYALALDDLGEPWRRAEVAAQEIEVVGSTLVYEARA